MSTDTKVVIGFAVIVAAWMALIWWTTPKGPDERRRAPTTRRPR